MTTNKALQSIIHETTGLIHRIEGKYAASVIADFNDALAASENQHKTAYQWLQDYKKPGKRAKRVEQQPKREIPNQYPKHKQEFWTAYKPTGNKFAEMWDCTNILTEPISPSANPKKVQFLIDRKLFALKKLITLVDTDTKDHFRMALAAVLRDEQYQDIRKEAIYLLAQHCNWADIEWTFWLHGKRRREDHYMLIAAETWCNSKTKDAKALHKAVADATRQLLMESIR